MRLPAFEYLAPPSLDEALAALEERGQGAAVLAGGTDLVPRLRQRLLRPDLVLSLKNLTALRGIEVEGINLSVGALTGLREIMDFSEVKTSLPGLAEALFLVGAPGLQHETGTIGGNILQDLRCIHYNQSEWHRSGRERCHRNGGQVCNALADSRDCWSSCQSDGAVMLAALSAQVELRRTGGSRTIMLTELFSGQGEAPFTLGQGELLTRILVPLPPAGSGTAYAKLRWRSAVDYPFACAGAFVSLSGGKVDRVRLAVGAAGPAPLVIGEADRLMRGQAPTPELIDRAAEAARKAAEGLIVENALAPAEYRRKMVGVMARRALASAVSRAQQ